MVHCALTIMIWVACGCVAISDVSAYVGQAFAEGDDEEAAEATEWDDRDGADPEEEDLEGEEET